MQAQERKEAIVKVPEKIILSELRKMVDNMQAMNKRLEETVSSKLTACLCLSVALFLSVRIQMVAYIFFLLFSKTFSARWK